MTIVGPRSNAGKLISSLLGEVTDAPKFSRQPATDATGEHISQDELAQIAEQWKQQYQGAADIRVFPAQDQAEVNEMLAIVITSYSIHYTKLYDRCRPARCLPDRGR